MESECSLCDKPAVYRNPHEGRDFCRGHFIKYFEKKFWKAVRKERMLDISAGKIGVALSGGKDSSVVLYLLSRRMEKFGSVEMEAVFIDEGAKGYRERCLQNAKALCKDAGVKLHVFSFRKEIGFGLDSLAKKVQGESLCSYCGVFRRKMLNEKARKLGFSRIFTGHNLDDEAETVILDFLKGDLNRFVRLRHSPLKSEEFVPRMKPLRGIPIKEISLYAKLKKIPHHPKPCPYLPRGSTRYEVRKFIDSFEKGHDGVKYTIVGMAERVISLIAENAPSGTLSSCHVCGEPTSRDVCKSCELLKKLKKR